MKTEEIIWKDPFTATGTVNAIGNLNELFTGSKMLFVTKNLEKRATFMFDNGKAGAEHKTATVACSDAVNKLYRAGKLQASQIIGFPVIKGEATNKATGLKEPALFVSLPPQGWMEVANIKVTAYTPAPVDFNDRSLAGL